jgi:MraZ protein
MPQVQTDSPILYTGQFRHGVDESRRVMIPARWRPKAPRIQYVMILWPIAVEGYLLVLPPDRWYALLDNLKKQSLSNEKVAALERVLGSTSASLELDKVGRLCLPEDFAKTVGIDREAELVGRVDKFEIWSPAKCAAARPEDKKMAAEIVSQITL